MARYVDPGHINGPVFIPGVAAMRLIWRMPSGKEVSNVLHGSGAVAGNRTQAYVNGLYTAVQTAWESTGYRPACSNLFSLQAVGYRDLSEASPNVGYAEIRSNLAATAGEATDNPLPANVSFVITLKSQFRGQANRGRIYFTGFTEDSNDANGNPEDDLKNALVDFAGAVDSLMTSHGLTLCIAQPARQAYDSPVPPFTHHPAREAGSVPVIGISAHDQLWDSTRLRKIS